MNQKQRDRIDEAHLIICEVLDEEEEKLANMEESFSETAKYEEMEEKKDELLEIQGYIDNFINE